MRPDEGYDTLNSGAFVYGEKTPRGSPALWPVLAVKAGRASRNLKIRVALFYASQNESGDETLQALGWRFEPPEDVDGAHSYYHAQPISSFDSSGRWRLPTSGAVNHAYPAFPLRATDSLTLLTALLVSLYGRTNVGAMLNDSQLRQHIRPVVKNLEPWL
jgi:hypothetical protein